MAHAHVVLVKEELSAAGEVVSATSFDLTPDGVPNSGSATVVIPTSAYSAIIPVSGATSQRYFLFLHATKLSNMKGWSKGYFSVAAPPASQEGVATVTPGSLRVATPSVERLDEASTPAATRRAKSLVKLPEMHTEVGHHSNVHFNKLSALFGTEYMKEHHGRKHLALADRELVSRTVCSSIFCTGKVLWRECLILHSFCNIRLHRQYSLWTGAVVNLLWVHERHHLYGHGGWHFRFCHNLRHRLPCRRVDRCVRAAVVVAG